jgi:hypothetical protein
VGSGLNSFYARGSTQVYALAASGNALYAGGFFSTAGTNVSAFVAEAILAPSSAPPFIITTNSSFGFSAGHSSFGFDVSGSPAQTVAVMASTNMANWVPLQTNVLGSSSFHFSDPSASNFARRFYRAELLP